MFLSGLFVIAQNWKELKCPSADKWIKKMLFLFTMEYYKAIKMKHALEISIKWIGVESIILGEVKQTQNVLICEY